MLVRMLRHITGTRDGQEWPNRGGVLEVPAHEGADLITAGLAEEVTDASDPTVEDPAPTEDGDDAAPEPDGDGDPATEDGDDAAPADTEPLKPKASRSRARKATA